MSPMRMSEEDKQKLIEFLNLVAKHAKFRLNTTELIQYFKVLSYMQQKLLPKIEANILEVKQVVEPDAVESQKSEGKK